MNKVKILGKRNKSPILHVRILRLSLLTALCMGPVGLTLSDAQAQQGPFQTSIPTPFEGIEQSRGEPVTLVADQLDYDRNTKIVIAQGQVEVSQGETILQADSIIYDQRNNLVFAQGNVVVLEPSGNVYFAEEVELSDSMKRGVVSNIRARLSDNSLFAAEEGERKNEFITELTRAVYSPCSVVCEDGSPKEPLWQIKAKRAVIDREEQEVTYNHAYMDIYGFPVLYTPYLSHAMPGADSKSGFLAPQYRHDDNLGHVVQVPFYWAIAADKDLTATYMHTTDEAPVLVGEYRQRFDSGLMKLSGSATQTDDRDALGNLKRGNTFRGHFFGDGAFELSNRWQWGFDINRTTDDTYLRRYDINRDPLLTSRVFGEGFNFIGDSDRSYIVAEGLAFQGLQQQDDRSRSPLILPSVEMYYQTLPLWANSRVTLTGGLMALQRDVGADSRRVSVSGAWMVPYVTEAGHILELETKLRADAYHIDDHLLPNATLFEGSEQRVIPQASLTWRYPLINRFEESSLIVEPMVMAIASPTSGNSQNIPNEDSTTPEFTDTNLFSDNRFPGYDRVEVGPRVNYGVRTQWQFLDDKYISTLLGQSYRTDDSPLFPLSSNLNSRFSDYVGKIGMTFDPLDLAFRFRLDEDDYTLNRSEVQSTLRITDWATVNGNYLRLRNDPILTEREEIIGSLGIRLSDEWYWSVSGHRDLLQDRLVTANTSLIYRNECISIHTSAGRNYTQDRDFRESTAFTVQVFFKNLN